MDAKTDMKPVPVPRSKGNPDCQNNNTHDMTEVKKSKPIPLPRKLFQRLSLSSSEKKKTNDNKLPFNQNSFDDELLTDEVKRGTINIFKRGKSIDPFEEFEKTFEEPNPLKDVRFPAPELSDEVRASFPSRSSSSLNHCDSDSSENYYDQPGKLKNEAHNIYEFISGSTVCSRSIGSLPQDHRYQADNSEESLPIIERNSIVSDDFIVVPSPSPPPSIPSHTATNNNNENESIQSRSTSSLPQIASDVSLKNSYDIPYSKLCDETHNTSVTNSSSSGNTRATSLPCLETTKPRRSNRFSEGSNRSMPCRKLDNVYDDVAIEDGTVVFLDNQMNTKFKLLPRFDGARYSIVKEFDPLFDLKEEDGPKRSSSLSLLEENGEEAGEESHSYDEIEYEDGVGGACGLPKTIAIQPVCADFDNPTYLTLESCSEGRENDIALQTAPSQPQSAEETGADTAITADEEKPLPEKLKRSEGSFLRRIGHKIRLNPIREESVVSRRASDDNLTTLPRCTTCNSEHGENVTCKFVPSIRDNKYYSSHLYRPAGIVQKDYTKRWVALASGKLSVYNDKKTVIEEFALDKGTVIYKKNDKKNKLTSDGVELKPFEINFGGKNTVLLAAASEQDRASWMRKWAEIYINILPPNIISSFDRGGWCFIKEGVTSEWYPSWLILKDRTLIHGVAGGGEYFELDLRKARSVDLSTSKDVKNKCPFVDNFEVLTIDISKIIFIQTEVVKITNSWMKIIGPAATQNGTNLDEMQLTLKDIPVIVDKCIDFISAHGTLSEGIYRHSGSNSRITQLLASFQKDAWSVVIPDKEFSVHDVAGTLKRFFRTLPDALFTGELYATWIATARIQNDDAKMKAYSGLLSLLPKINRNILNKLICHLLAVHEMHEKNLMPLNNLASIWGPTLMNVETPLTVPQTLKDSDDQYRSACAESEVVKDLISNYYVLFRVDENEREKEKKMLDAFENFRIITSQRKTSGDMMSSIYIWEKDDSTAINIALSPKGTAHSIVQQLCRTAQLRNYENLAIHEVIWGNSLERPLHPSEIVVESVLRWTIWDVEERKNNYLILKKNALYPALMPYIKEPTLVFGEFKFADSKSKSFKKHYFKFASAILKIYKHPKATTELGSWNIEDIVWYVGSESKRNPSPKWAFTFVKRNYPFKRSREEPYFGNTVSCNTQEELHKWIAAMIIAEHPSGLYPAIIV